jgi:hypothetical protein
MLRFVMTCLLSSSAVVHPGSIRKNVLRLEATVDKKLLRPFLIARTVVINDRAGIDLITTSALTMSVERDASPELMHAKQTYRTGTSQWAVSM